MTYDRAERDRDAGVRRVYLRCPDELYARLAALAAQLEAQRGSPVGITTYAVEVLTRHCATLAQGGAS